MVKFRSVGCCVGGVTPDAELKAVQPCTLKSTFRDHRRQTCVKIFLGTAVMEFLSHLPSTSPTANPLRPTLFELIAQDQLRDLIQPALRYLVAVPSLGFLFLILVLCSTLPQISP
jgi:hypothetical protein